MDSDRRDLLLSLAYFYICCGRDWRALPLLLLVIAQSPDDCECLRMLAHVYIMVDRGELALVVLDRMRQLSPTIIAGDALLRARALQRLGRNEEARHVFDQYIQAMAA